MARKVSPSGKPGILADMPTVALALLADLRRARDHIDRHYRQPLDLDTLAAVARVSKFHFARSFEAAYGEPPMRYPARRRIERAQDLLRGSNLTVTEVCMRVGYFQPRLVLVAVRPAGRREPDGLPRALGRPVRAGLSSHTPRGPGTHRRRCVRGVRGVCGLPVTRRAPAPRPPRVRRRGRPRPAVPRACPPRRCARRRARRSGRPATPSRAGGRRRTPCAAP